LEELGNYQIVAKDSLGNKTVVSFMINVDTHMNIVGDINDEHYTINAVEFSNRYLVRVDIGYDSNGYSNVFVKLNNFNIKANDMLYVLGVVPNTNNTFVMFSVNGTNITNYSSGVNLIGNGSNFKNGVNNEDCFIKFNDYYYAYVLIRENASKGPVAVVDDNTENKDNSGLLNVLLIALGIAIVLATGYLIMRMKKKVRAA
jgi:hypothetical protein